jgi:YD repeat-containing protein
LIGRLVDHGTANYQFRTAEDPSYFVKLLTSSGERVLWGKDLARAIAEGATAPKSGDLVGARRIAREAVTVTSRQRDADGRVVAQEDRQAHRTRWVVEKVKFFAERAKLARQVREDHVDVSAAVRANPELKSTFLSIRAAEELAARKIADPEDRERFLELVRGALAGSIRRGEPLPATRLRAKPAERPKPVPSREEPTR